MADAREMRSISIVILPSFVTYVSLMFYDFQCPFSPQLIHQLISSTSLISCKHPLELLSKINIFSSIPSLFCSLLQDLLPLLNTSCASSMHFNLILNSVQLGRHTPDGIGRGGRWLRTWSRCSKYVAELTDCLGLIFITEHRRCG